MEPSRAKYQRATATSGAVRWLVLLVFASLTSLLFVGLFEWSRYAQVVGWQGLDLSVADKALTLWLLWAKCVAYLFPVLLVAGICLIPGWRWAATVVLSLGWTVVFYFMAADTILLSYSGAHVSDYLPYLEDMVKSSTYQHIEWLGEGIVFEAVTVLLAVVVTGLLSYSASSWLTSKLIHRYSWIKRPLGLIAITLSFCLLFSGVVPALTFYQSDAILLRVYSALPLGKDFLWASTGKGRRLLASITSGHGIGGKPGKNEASLDTTGAGDFNSAGLVLENPTNQDLELNGYQILDVRGNRCALKGLIRSGKTKHVGWPEGLEAMGQLFLIDPEGYLRYTATSFFGGSTVNLVITEPDSTIPDTGINVEKEIDNIRPFFFDHVLKPKPVDRDAFVNRSPLPNVITIVVESFRHVALTPDLMKRMHAWSNRGLRLERHYSGSNCSHLGLFTLLYGRVGSSYDQVLNKSIPPQMCQSLRRSGYRCSLVTAGEKRGFRRMDEYLSPANFDEIVVTGSFDSADYGSWPSCDRKALAEVRRILKSPGDTPHFVFVFLMSTHYPYHFDPQFAIHKPCHLGSRLYSSRRRALRNRYKNSALFLENEIMNLIDSLDPLRNIVIVTGDHGESLGEDNGYVGHISDPSESQTRVPFIMAGPGIEPKTLGIPTSHLDVVPTLLHALAGKPVPLLHCDGRDLLGPHPEDGPDPIITDFDMLEQKLVVIRDRTRLLFTRRRKGRELTNIAFEGFLNEKGRTIDLGRARRLTRAARARLTN